MLLYVETQNNVDVNEVNIDDTVWAANQAQIAQWIAAKGFTFYTDTHPEPDDETLLNIGQVQTWVNQLVAPAGGTAIAPGALADAQAQTAAAAAGSSAKTVIAVVAGVGLVGALLYLASRR